MRTFMCPACKKTQQAIGNAAAHICPSNHSKLTQFEVVRQNEEASR